MDLHLQLLKRAAAIDPAAKDAYIAALERVVGGTPISETDELKDVLEKHLGAIWVIDDEGDPGLALTKLGVGIGYYKWHDTFIVRHLNDYKWRQADKRELSRSIAF